MKKVYLAGPITGTSWNESEGWRDELKRLAEISGMFHEVRFFSPLRGKTYLQQAATIFDTYDDTLYSSAKAIMERDFHDVETADAIIANFDGAKKVSIGTVMEIAWAHARRIPVVVITGSDTFHDHAMIRQASWYRVNNIETALDALSYLFNE